MLVANQPEDKTVVVNKPALQAWLHAWTTGASFSISSNLPSGLPKKEALTLIAVRRMRSRMAKDIVQ